MKYDDEDSAWIFESTGKRSYAHTDTLGLDQAGVSVSYGADGGFDEIGWRYTDYTFEERLELADELVARANRFRDAVLLGCVNPEKL